MPKTKVGRQTRNAKREKWLAAFKANGQNATEAARTAKYAHPNVMGPRLKKELWDSRIQPELEKAATEAGITEARVLRELEALTFSNVDHYMMDPATGRLILAPGAPPNAMQAVASVKYGSTTTRRGEATEVEHWCELKLWDKPGAIKLSGRHVDVHGFHERMELTGKNGAPIETVSEVRVVLVDPGDAKP